MSLPGAPRSTPPSRRTFALTGRSVALPTRTHAVRADLADVRLADQVFAPHYAEAVESLLATNAAMRAERETGSEILVELRAGDTFELLDLIGDAAWGVAPMHGLVGYIPAAALGLPA